MATQLTEKCSFYKTYFHKGKWCMSTVPETINIIDFLMIDWQGGFVDKIRAIEDKQERDKIKVQLWGMTPSAIQEGGRGNKYIVQHSGLIAFDIDTKENPFLSDPEQFIIIKQLISEIPYTVYCGLSASGKGLWGLFRISHPHLHKRHFIAMSKAFLDFGIAIDQAPSSPASLRFISYDENGFYNEDPMLFDLLVQEDDFKIERKNENIIDMSKGKIHQNISGKEQNKNAVALRKKFNDECTAEIMHDILTCFGFNYDSHDSKGNLRFTRIGKKSGVSVDYKPSTRSLFCFSDNVQGLEHWKKDNGGWSCSPLTALMVYGMGGFTNRDWARAYMFIKQNVGDVIH